MKRFSKLSDLAVKLEDELDFDFRAESTRIDSFDEFYNNIIKPYEQGNRVFFRGERISSLERPLLPSIFRHRDILLGDELLVQYDSKKLLEFYSKFPDYTQLYQSLIGCISEDNLYPFLSFSQHYFGLSPLIDLTKNPFVAMSFALKNRTEYDEDILFYTVEIKDEADYTTELSTANSWIKQYNVIVFKGLGISTSDISFDIKWDSFLKYKDMFEELKGKSIFEANAPSARLIDVPNNDLMRFQQGVFLLLDDFTILGNAYLTKKIRDDFAIKKWIVNKEICFELLEYQKKIAPHYNYDSITDLSKVVGKIKKIYF